jgi:integrase
MMTQGSFETNPMRDSGDYVEDETYQKILSACQSDLEKMYVMLHWKTGRRITEIVGGHVRHKNFTKAVDERGNKTRIWDGTFTEFNLAGLTPRDIDWEHGKIHFFILKKKELLKKPKDVDQALLTELHSYIESHQIGLDDRVIPRTRRWANMLLNRITAKEGITTFDGHKLHTHMFRHSWNIKAARTLNSAEDIVLQKDYMEHSNINITMSYLKYAEGRQKKLIDKMAGENEVEPHGA